MTNTKDTELTWGEPGIETEAEAKAVARAWEDARVRYAAAAEALQQAAAACTAAAGAAAEARRSPGADDGFPWDLLDQAAEGAAVRASRAAHRAFDVFGRAFDAGRVARRASGLLDELGEGGVHPLPAAVARALAAAPVGAPGGEGP